MDSLRADNVNQAGVAKQTRAAQESKFGGYSIQVVDKPKGGPGPSPSSIVPEIQVRRHRGLFQMLCDWISSKSGQAPVQELRKVDALISYIKTGEAYESDGRRLGTSLVLPESRYKVLQQVLGNKYATDDQKDDAVKAFFSYMSKEIASDSTKDMKRENVDLLYKAFLGIAGRSTKATQEVVCEALLTLLKKDPEALTLDQLNHVESSLEHQMSVQTGKASAELKKEVALAQEKVQIPKDLEGIKDANKGLEGRVSAFRRVMDSRTATPEQKKQACEDLRNSLEKSTLRAADKEVLTGLQDFLRGISRNPMYNEQLDALKGVAGVKVNFLKADEDITKIETPVRCDVSTFNQGTLDEVSKALDGKIKLLKGVLNNIAATPEQKEQAGKALGKILSEIPPKFMSNKVVEDIDVVLVNHSRSVPNLEKCIGIEKVKVDRSLYTLRSGKTPGTCALLGAEAYEASPSERFEAFGIVMDNASEPKVRDEACQHMKGFLEGAAPDYEGIQRSDLAVLQYRDIEKGDLPEGLVDLASKISDVKTCKEQSEAALKELLSLTPENAGKGGLAAYDQKLQAAKRADDNYVAARAELGQKVSPNWQIQRMHAGFEQLKEALDKPDEYMKDLRGYSQDAWNARFKKMKYPNGITAFVSVPKEKLALGVVQFFHTVATARPEDYWNENSNELNNPSYFIMNGFALMPNRDDYLDYL